jgi:hypothetical protein
MASAKVPTRALVLSSAAAGLPHGSGAHPRRPLAACGGARWALLVGQKRTGHSLPLLALAYTPPEVLAVSVLVARAAPRHRAPPP